MNHKASQILISCMKSAQKLHTNDWWTFYNEYLKNEDFQFAKEHSVMFEKVNISHDEIFIRISKAIKQISKLDIVNSFISSLSTRNLWFRSFLSSYCIGKVAPIHSFVPADIPNQNICKICGLHLIDSEEYIDFNVTNFFKYTEGCCFTSAKDILFDLEIFIKCSKPIPNKNDYNILYNIKSIIENSSPNDKITQLRKSFKNCIESNESERQSILEILGICDILTDNNHLGYCENYIEYPDRKYRPVRYDDIEYPARWWTGKNSINPKYWNYWFDTKNDI